MEAGEADPEELFQQAVSARDEGELPSALQTTLQLLSQVPDSPRGRLLLANIYFLSGCIELASEEVLRLADRYPDRESLKRLLKSLDPSFAIREETEATEAEASPEVKKVGDSSGGSAREGENRSTDVADSVAVSEEKREDQLEEAKSKTSPVESKPREEAVIAETDFEFDDLDLLGEDD